MSKTLTRQTVPFKLLIGFLVIASAFDPIKGDDAPAIGSPTDTGVKCTPCTQPSPPPPPPPSPPPPPKKPPTPNCPPPPHPVVYPPPFIYITGPPGELYPIDSYNGAAPNSMVGVPLGVMITSGLLVGSTAFDMSSPCVHHHVCVSGTSSSSLSITLVVGLVW
ncbi:hypothetical protein RJ641_012749 [Dillenia turbinata]|uniref:Uncharacterized protein n=1 Tax=Dillenia turbinata TaxID=194707 RepID=A0AAN8V7P5_9MAGN